MTAEEKIARAEQLLRTFDEWFTTERAALTKDDLDTLAHLLYEIEARVEDLRQRARELQRQPD